MSQVRLPAVADPQRLAALRSLRLLDTPAEPAFDRLTRLASRVLDVPIVLVSLVDEDRQFFKSCVGLPEPWASARETPLSHSFCQHTVDSGEPLIISDARLHPLVADNLAIPDLNVVAYAGIPLITDEGFVLGSLCAIDTQPRSWTPDDIATLTDLAASVLTEITLRMDREEVQRHAADLKVRYDEAQAALALRDRFLSIAAHDLNSPIAALMGYATLIQKRLDRAGTLVGETRMLGTIANQARHLSQMIGALLDFSHLQYGGMTLTVKPVDVGGLVQRIVDQMQIITTDRTIAAQVPAAPLMIEGDEIRLQQALQNLVQNAIKYSPAGSLVRVTAEQTGETVTLTVQDHGRGIAPELQPQLFDEFFRADPVPGYPGLGLGLYVVKEIASLHGGSVGVVSAPGQGSTFTLRLPVAQPVLSAS